MSATSSGRIRVLHVLNTLQTGGAEYLVLNIAKVFDRNRFDLLVASMTVDGEIGDELRAVGIPTFLLARRSGLDPMLVPKLVGLIRRESIDVIHSHNVAPWLYGGIAARLAGAAICHTEHSNLFANQKALKRAERGLGYLTRAVIADGEDVRRQLIDQQGLSPRKVITIYNGVDTALYGQTGNRTALRKAAGIPDDAIVIGTVARQEPVKDQATLVRAFADVLVGEPRARLALVGDGSQRPALEKQVVDAGLAGKVSFLGRRADVAALLPMFDVFALSSVSEGLPLTILEAMAAALPCVSTAVGAVPEAIVEGETGLLVPVGDAPKMAAAFVKLLRDPGLCARMGKAGQARARDMFDLRAMTRRYEDLWAAR